MAVLISIPPANVTTGDLNVSLSPPTDQTATLVSLETTSTHTIPAGARNVRIENAGGTSSGGVPATATVLGNDFSVGRIWEPNKQDDLSGNIEKELPSIQIDGNGSMMYISYMT